MTRTKPTTRAAKVARPWQPAYSAWAVIGVHPDGREETLDVGTREGVQASYSRLFNCPMYDAVYLKDLNARPPKEQERA